MQKRIFALLLLLLSALAVPACGPGTSLVGSWTDPQFSELRLHKVLVYAMVKDPWRRSMFEKAFQTELAKYGVECVLSMELLPEDEKLTEETFNKYFSDLGIDGALVSRLVELNTDQESYLEYRPPFGPGSVMGYGGFYGYYNFAWGYINSSPTVMRDQVFQVETNLFETTKGALVWNGLSRTVNPEKISDLANPISRTVVDDLVDKQLIEKK